MCNIRVEHWWRGQNFKCYALHNLWTTHYQMIISDCHPPPSTLQYGGTRACRVTPILPEIKHRVLVVVCVWCSERGVLRLIDAAQRSLPVLKVTRLHDDEDDKLTVGFQVT